MSVYTDLERILPRHRYDPRYGFYNDDYEDLDNPPPKNGNLDSATKQKFDQLAKLHELYSNRLAKANVTNSETYQEQMLKRCESLSFSDMLYGVTHDNSSIYSEPAYVPEEEKFCENCKVSMFRPATAQNWHVDTHLSASTTNLSQPVTSPLSKRFQRYSHKYNRDSNFMNLRHPDGASNPNLQEETERVPGNGLPAPTEESLPKTRRT